MELARFVVDHPAAHRDGVLQDFIGNAELLERMNSTGGKRQIDRAAAHEVAGARIGSPLVQLDLIPAPAEIGREQPAGQTATDQNKLRSHSEK